MNEARDNPAGLSAQEIAARVGGRLSGDGQRQIRGIATLANAGPEELAWVGNARYLKDLANSRAGIVLIPENVAAPPDRTTILVADPDLAVCAVQLALAPPTPTVARGVAAGAVVDPSATVDGAAIGAGAWIGPRVVVGSGTQIHPGVYIGPDARIGHDCVLWPGVVVRERCRIGDRVVLHPNAVIGADGFGYLFRNGRHHKVPQTGIVVIEDDVEIGANAAVDRARSGETRIGRGTKIDNLVQIAHNVRIGENCIVVSQCGLSGSTTLGNFVVMGGQVGLSDHVKIGDRVQIGAQSGISHDLPDDSSYFGSPAIPLRDFARSYAGWKRLPATIEQLRALARRIEQLESAAHDRTRG